MKERIYEGSFAGRPLRYAFHYADTPRYMAPYLAPYNGDDYDLMASHEYMDSQRPFYPECTDDPYVEYKSLIGLTSLELLPCGSCLFHAVAIRKDGLAWLLTGRSGVGKTTQYKNWKILFKNDVQMICGDMPVLESMDDGSIMVHPSPWNGKERIKGNGSALLGGILLLEQGTENRIRRLGAEESVLPVLEQFAVMPDTEEQVRQLAWLADRMLRRCPVWKMTNRGDRGSTMLAAETFWNHMKEEAGL